MLEVVLIDVTVSVPCNMTHIFLSGYIKHL